MIANEIASKPAQIGEAWERVACEGESTRGACGASGQGEWAVVGARMLCLQRVARNQLHHQEVQAILGAELEHRFNIAVVELRES